MTQTTTTQIIAAASDGHLRARMIATAARQGIPNPQGHVESQIQRIVSTPLDTEGTTVASVFAYATATYTPVPLPGENLAAVTDAQLAQALEAIV